MQHAAGIDFAQLVSDSGPTRLAHRMLKQAVAPLPQAEWAKDIKQPLLPFVAAKLYLGATLDAMKFASLYMQPAYFEAQARCLLEISVLTAEMWEYATLTATRSGAHEILGVLEELAELIVSLTPSCLGATMEASGAKEVEDAIRRLESCKLKKKSRSHHG